MARRRGGGAGGGGGHDAAGMMRWLLTYSDLITLMMAFFVIMYAMSKADVSKFNALKTSLAVAFRTDGDSSSIVFDQPGTQPTQQVTMDSMQEAQDFQDIIRKIQENVKDQRMVGFNLDERGLTIRFLDNVLFDVGRAELRPDSYNLLDAVGKALKNNPHYVRIEGHADNLPIHTTQYPSNWELSAARSIAVTRYLIDHHGLEPRKMASLGYGEYRPLLPNTSDENRAKNRRVDIIVLRSDRSGGEIGAGQPAPLAQQPN